MFLLAMWQGDRAPRRPLRWALSGAMDLCGVGASIQNGNAANAPQLIPRPMSPAWSGSSLPTLVVQKKGLRVKYLSSAVSGLAVIVALGAPFPHAALATPTFVQGTAFSTARLSSYAIPLTRPVAQGDLLVGWFSQYNAPGESQVSDNVNGAWTRVAAGALTFDDDTGDIALYYRENSRAAPGGLTITVSVSTTAYFQGAVAEYSGIAPPGNTSAEWYAVCAVFHPYSATPPVPPSTPTDLAATGVASTRVALSWSPSGGSVAGYTVYRNGAAIGTTGPDTTIFLDAQVTPSTTHAYSVDAFDLANHHSAPSAPLTVTTPAQSPEFVQGVAASPASRSSSYTLTLRQPVLAGDLLVGWFSQYNASGQVRVSDNVNGSWTRSVATTWR